MGNRKERGLAQSKKWVCVSVCVCAKRESEECEAENARPEKKSWIGPDGEEPFL